MKIIVLILLLTSFVSLSSAAQPGKSIELVYYHQAIPYSMETDTGQMTGIFIDILNEVLNKRMGLDVNHYGFPWARAQKMVEAGKADGFCTTINPKRERYVNFLKTPIVRARLVLATNKTNPRINQIKKISNRDQLKDFSLVTYIGNGFVALRPELTFIKTSNSVNALKMIHKNRADIFIELDSHIDFIAAKIQAQDDIFKKILPELPIIDFHLGISKISRLSPMIKEIEKIILQVNKDGTYQKILQKYGSNN